jgi:hypothetical protein
MASAARAGWQQPKSGYGGHFRAVQGFRYYGRSDETSSIALRRAADGADSQGLAQAGTGTEPR